MTNEAHWDYILTKHHRKENGVVKQRDNLENHAKQITQYLQAQSVDDPVTSPDSPDHEDTSLPGVKVHFTFPDRGEKPARSSMRKLPKKSNSMRDKKKNTESDKKSGRRKSALSPDEEKQVVVVTADHSPRRLDEVPVAEPETRVCEATSREERPIITSLNSSELMLVSADKGDLGTMQVLFDKPSDHSRSLCITKDEKGETPLHKTAKGGYLKCMKFLISQLPDEVSCIDNLGMTPAAYAAKNGHVNCLKWLVEETSAYVELAVRDGQMSLLHYAAKEGMEQCLNYLLAFMAKRKITTDIIDGQGQTPLHLAARMGHLACVQTLVENGADVLAKDHEGLSSANVAYLQKQSICSRYLLMAESCWILASRVATLFREVNGFKKENKELKKTVENLKTSKKCALPNRPETVGAHTNDNSNPLDDFSRRESEMTPIGPRNFPDGESPKSTFTEADKQRPQIISQKQHVINKDGEVKDFQHFKVVRTASLDCHVIPTVSTNGIAEIPPAEKVKAKEIAMVTHQLMSARHLQMIQDKKAKQMATEVKKPQAAVDDSMVEVLRRTTLNRSRDTCTRPKSLCDNQLTFMRSNTDIDFAYKLSKKKSVLERRASCTELAAQCENDAKEPLPKEKNFWDKVGARKLLSRKKSLKSTQASAGGGGLSDLQTVSTDKILELYARESRGSCTRINSFIREESETSTALGRRTLSSTELKSPRDTGIHASFREPRANFRPLSGLRMSERYTPSTSSSKDIESRERIAVEKKVRPVAKPRLKLRSNSTNSDSSECSTPRSVVMTDNIERPLKDGIINSSATNRTFDEECHNDAKWGDLKDLGTTSNETDNSLECTDV